MPNSDNGAVGLPSRTIGLLDVSVTSPLAVFTVAVHAAETCRSRSATRPASRLTGAGAERDDLRRAVPTVTVIVRLAPPRLASTDWSARPRSPQLESKVVASLAVAVYRNRGSAVRAAKNQVATAVQCHGGNVQRIAAVRIVNGGDQIINCRNPPGTV